MPKMMKPIIVIVLAVGVAAGAAVFLSRQPDAPEETNAAPLTVDIKTPGHFRGPEDAVVTLVEFGDYQCPSCASMQPIIDRLLKEFGDKARLVARDFPLRQHAYAIKAAEAAEAAREQGKYWEYTALLYGNQAALSIEDLKKYASQLGLDRQIFDQALDSGKFADRVQRDMEDGLKVGVNSTPAFYINGKQVPSNTYEALKQALEAALRVEAKRNAASKP